ncbi:hypothetical protein N0V82_006828 [Gnomoniopsis sp. IMI 355080]|nr:hypothetical protein N0V82_006828 [Gnomoniopsis sp. IMI 355080]
MADSSPSPSNGAVVSDGHTVQPPLTTWELLESMDFMALEFQMVISAIFIIYVGAHASLRRPPSAAPPERNKNKKRKKDGKDELKEQFAPGFEASDAILFPLMAGTVLIGLYYLIKWLQDPAILNTILRWYMSITGVIGTGTFLGNATQVLLGFVFPDHWVDGKGKVWDIDSRYRTQSSHIEGEEVQITKDAASKRTPFPGYASSLSLSSRLRETLFTVRHLLMEDWNLQLNIWGMGQETIPFKFTTLIGCGLGVVLQGSYLYTGNNMLANIIGLAVCYMAFMYMSVTSFPIGSLVLAGLFVYDIIMVFYTPFMVGVATQLDVPIKLTYKTANRSSMLGLGDIVIPGIFICLALRFDLWKHYQRKITKEETVLTTISGNKQGLGGDVQEITTTEKVFREVKAPFVDPRGQWGNHFWTTSWRNLFFGNSSSSSVANGEFAKTYFHATMLGYLLGLLVTIGILLIFKRGQPALLYLVPGVLGSVYLTGWWRGEMSDLFKYTENGDLDTKDVVVEVDGDGKPIEADTKPVKDTTDGENKPDSAVDVKKDGEKRKEAYEAYEVFTFSITAPGEEVISKKD